MSKSIQEIEGIGPKFGEKLKEEGIHTTEKLLEIGASKKGRKSLSEKTEISEKYILSWVNMCDLFRISGVAGQYAELLEASGVDTVKELRNRNAENLASKMLEVNEQKKLCKVPPNAKMVANWILQAKALEPKVTH